MARRTRRSLTAQAFEDDADLVLGRVVLAGGPADVAHDFLGGRLGGRLLGGGGGGFLAHLHSPRGYDEPEILRSSTTPVCLKGADVGHLWAERLLRAGLLPEQS
jgi:hypothetical protein